MFYELFMILNLKRLRYKQVKYVRRHFCMMGQTCTETLLHEGSNMHGDFLHEGKLLQEGKKK